MQAEPPEPTPSQPPDGASEHAVIHTSVGTLKLELWNEVAPNTVSNFKELARAGFYNGTCFHRVVQGFMIQGGDPLTRDPAHERLWGTGDPGYSIPAEFNDRSHVRGVISMARSEHPDSAGSQFFICLADASFLDGQYTAFGRVIEGDPVLASIGNVPVRPGPDGEVSRPVDRISVESIRVAGTAG